MKNSYEVTVSTPDKIILDIGAGAKSSVRSIQNVLKRYEPKLEEYDVLEVNVYPQEGYDDFE